MNPRKNLPCPVFASALALAFISAALPAAEVTDGAVPLTMDEDGTHYVIGATGAYNLTFGDRTKVGDLNTVSLTVQNGSIFSSKWSEIGQGSAAGAPGGNSVLVTGQNSQWTMSSGLYVGRNTPNNTLTIADGGKVTTNFTTIGDGGGGKDNTVTVTGNGSIFNGNGITYVGYYGSNSQLRVEAGGTAITGNASIGYHYSSNGTVTVTGAGSNLTITGTAVLGRVSSGNTATATGGTGTLIVDDGGLVHAVNMGIAQGATSTGTLTIASGGTIEFTGTLKLGLFAGATANVNLNTGGTLQIADTTTEAIAAGAGNVAFNFAGGTLQVGGDSDGSMLTTSVPMTLSNAATVDTHGNTAALSGALSGSGSLTKIGAGTLTLSGINSYTGATQTSEGTLIVNGSLASTTVAIANGATLGGSGSIGGLTTLASGAHLAPGNSPGTLTFIDGLTLEAGSFLDFELGTTSDLIRVSGGTLVGPNGGTVTLNFLDAGDFDLVHGGTYTLFDFTGANTSGLNLTDFTFGTLFAGTSASQFALGLDATSLAVTYTPSAIPEPSVTAAIAGVLALGLALARRRRSELGVPAE